MTTSEQTNEIFAAMAQAQAATEAATKDNTNPAFRSKYADLTSHVEVIRPAAKVAGIAVFQDLTSDEQGVHVVTRFAHKSGQWVEFGPLFIPANKRDAQGFGSAASYARRYALSAAWGTVADDDDGNAAVRSMPEHREQARPEPRVVVTGLDGEHAGKGYLVRDYRKDGQFHTAVVMGASGDGSAIKVATKLGAVGKQLQQIADGKTPCRVDLTMKGKGEAWLNAITSETMASEHDLDAHTEPLDASAIPF